MRGSIIKRSRWSWSLVVDHGRDATTGRRKQKWVRFEVPRDVSAREAHKQAEAKLAELLHQMDKGTYIAAKKTTLIDFLRDWHGKAVVPLKRPETARIYSTMIEGHVAKASIATTLLQKVRPLDLEAFYAAVDLAPSSVDVLHAVIHRALRMAVRDGLIVANPASAVEHRPRASKDAGRGARRHCWSADEARKFLAAAEQVGPQAFAFFALALDTGARKSELLGLTWSDVDLEAGTVTISRQLDRWSTTTATWGPPKTDRTRVVTLGADALARLRKHRAQQRITRMANRTSYRDFGLVFAKEAADLQKPSAELGQPCPALADRYFRQITTAAGVTAMKFHGLRHTCATLLLNAGVPIQVVAQRLGHSEITMTLEVYAHALPDQQREAAAKLNAVLASGR